MSTIQWFPGHMAKAKRQIQEQLKLVDVVIEVVDARLPESSRNPELKQLLQNKPLLIILNKADLADSAATKAWQQYYQQQGIASLALDSQHGQPLKPVTRATRQLLATKIAQQASRGVKQTTVRAMCVGIPNTGKSTFLNRMIGKNVAQVGNRPGVTRKQNWLKAQANFEILDTPGVLWPKFADQLIGQKLALTGAIKEGLYHEDDIVLFALEFYQTHYPRQLQQTYHLSTEQLAMTPVDLMMSLTKKLGWREDYERLVTKFLLDYRKGKLGRITLDQVPATVAPAHE